MSAVRSRITDFITLNYLFGDAAALPEDEHSLIETGVVDSTGILELIEFLEDEFQIQVTEAETVPANLGSIAALTRYVTNKMA